MRGFGIAVLMVFLSSVAVAQTPSPLASPQFIGVAAAAKPADGVSRADYITKGRDAAAKRTANRFERMDANHDGVLIKDEMATFRAAHPRKKAQPQ